MLSQAQKDSYGTILAIYRAKLVEVRTQSGLLGAAGWETRKMSQV